VFVLVHEVSHVLLRQWGILLHDNEEAVDELTTVILKIFGEGDRARAPADYFSRQPPEAQLRAKGMLDDRHPLSVQRARNILGWLDDPDLVRKWQKILVPHMQTRLLEHLRRHPEPWTDQALVERELMLRSAPKD
jgi:hypothetical protein